MTTDIDTLTDDQIRVKAAEAMGWKPMLHEEPRSRSWMSPTADVEYWFADLPDPLHDLNDAVALAESQCICWGINKHSEGHSGAWANTGKTTGECTHADSPARALTMAVLEAIEATSPIEPT